jgi:Cu-Zn family superoxide dismutase
MLRLRTLSLLIPLLLIGCDKPNDPVEPVAGSAPTTVPATAPEPATPPPMSTSAPTTAAASGAQAVLMPTQGNSAGGELTLTPEAGGVHLTGRLTGLVAGGTHAFHIHETGDCSAPTADSAGPHFNPGGEPHGNRDAGAHHAGDMPNVVADATGTAQVDVLLDDVELGTSGPRDVLGRALIVHAQADDYSTQPSGNAGARIACGVIGRTTAASAPAIGTSLDTAPATGTLPPPTDEPVPAAPPADGTQPPTGPAATPETATPAPPSDDNGAA